MDQAPASGDDTRAPEPPAAPVPGPGEQLREARDARGESVEEVAAALHLTPAAIAALEANDYARFAAPIFVNGYVRKYADHLGIDPEPLLAALDQARLEMPPIRSELTARFPAPPGRGLPAEARIAVSMIAGVVALALLWMLLRATPVVDTPVETDPVPAPPVESDPVPVPPVAGDPPPVAASGVPAAPAAPALPDEGPVAEPAPAPAGTTDELVLTFSGGSWVEVIDAAGRRLAFGMSEDGDVLRLRGVAPFDILLGNAPNVAIDYNGSPYRDYPVSRQNVARFTLGPEAASTGINRRD